MVHKFHGDSWGLAPDDRNWTPPLQVEVPDPAIVHTPEKSVPLWADLIFPDGHTSTAKAFAQAWTSDTVRIQWVEESLACYAWVAPGQIRRRQLEQR
ncbi:hypothetical protein [Arthrobacter flavus]|uniref:Uncharacterized protein n=1 Tax=Arthrobacter flavus TaxID=95172 RepID=A0ABW4QBG4_9MICC